MTWLEKFRAGERREKWVYAALAASLVLIGMATLVTAGRAAQLVHRLVA
jgi:hypothetical protein